MSEVSIPKRRRYDTIALVTELQRERRNGLILGLVGLSILVVLIVLYVTVVRTDDVPEVPDASYAGAPSPAKAPPATAGRSEGASDRPLSPKPNTPPPATAGTPARPVVGTSSAKSGPVVIDLSGAKKTQLWVDGKPLGRDARLELSPGKHEIKAKMGKKIVSQTLVVEAGTSYTLVVDSRRRKLGLKPGK